MKLLLILLTSLLIACKSQATSSTVEEPSPFNPPVTNENVTNGLSITIKDSSNPSDWFKDEYNLNQFAGFKYESVLKYEDVQHGSYVISAEVVSKTNSFNEYAYVKFSGYTGFTGREAIMNSGTGATAHGANYSRMFNAYAGYLPGSASAVFTTNGLVVNFSGYSKPIEFVLIATN